MRFRCRPRPYTTLSRLRNDDRGGERRGRCRDDERIRDMNAATEIAAALEDDFRRFERGDRDRAGNRLREMRLGNGPADERPADRLRDDDRGFDRVRRDRGDEWVRESYPTAGELVADEGELPAGDRGAAGSDDRFR